MRNSAINVASIISLKTNNKAKTYRLALEASDFELGLR